MPNKFFKLNIHVTLVSFILIFHYQFEGCTIPKLTIPNGQGYGYLQNCSSIIQPSTVKHSCEIHFYCYDGFVMKGSPAITCRNGEWYTGEDGAPKCKA